MKCRQPKTIDYRGKEFQWGDVIEGVERAIDQLSQIVGDREKYKQRSRGDFPAVNFGYTLGPGDLVSILWRVTCTLGLTEPRNLMMWCRIHPG